MVDFRKSQEQNKQLSTIFEFRELTKKNHKTDEIDNIIMQCAELSSKSNQLNLDTKKAFNAIETSSKKKDVVGKKFNGLSKFTSNELIKSVNK